MAHLKTVLLLAAFIFGGMAAAGSSSALAKPVTATFDGLQLNAELRLAEGKSLQDGVVLMMPSPLGHHRMEIIVNTQDVLTQRGYNTLAPSLSLGYDNRRWYLDCGRPIKFTASMIFAEIDFWVKWLKGQGVKNITLFGHSLSANYITWYLHERAFADVRGAIILAPATLAYGERGIRRYEKRFKVSLAAVLARADQAVREGEGEMVMMEKTDFYFCPVADVTADAFVSLYRDLFSLDMPVLWQGLAKPSLLIIGTGDKRSPGIVEEAGKAAVNKSLEVVTIENGGHFFKGLYTDEAVDAMAAFIAGLR